MNQYIVKFKDGDSTTTFAENDKQAYTYATEYMTPKPQFASVTVRLVKGNV